MRRIGILTSGGDAPGMNAAIRGIVRCLNHENFEIFGILYGYDGILNQDFFKLNLRTVSETINHGGTILYTARSKKFMEPGGVKKAAEICKKCGLESIVTIGGDGTFKGALELSHQGIQCIGIPATIDNDLSCTDYSIGFDTAMNTATEMIDKIRDTSQAHSRCNVVEVMGRHCGNIALQTGIAVGATAILIPEIPYDIEKDVIRRIEYTKSIGKKHFIVIVTEELVDSKELSSEIQRRTGIDSRNTVLGHVQRGGNPSLRDRVTASLMGVRAAEILKSGINGNCRKNKVIVERDGKITDIDIEDIKKKRKKFDIELYKTALKLSI